MNRSKRLVSLAMAFALTLAMLGGIDHLAQTDAPAWALAAAMPPSVVQRSEAFAEDLGEADGAPHTEPAAADPLGRAVTSLAWLVLAGGTAAAVLMPPL